MQFRIQKGDQTNSLQGNRRRYGDKLHAKELLTIHSRKTSEFK